MSNAKVALLDIVLLQKTKQKTTTKKKRRPVSKQVYFQSNVLIQTVLSFFSRDI